MTGKRQKYFVLNVLDIDIDIDIEVEMSDKGKSINEHLGDYVELYYPEIKKTIGFCNYLLSQRVKELAKTINKDMAAVAERINKMRGGRMRFKEFEKDKED